jgi:hypothetical protein
LDIKKTPKIANSYFDEYTKNIRLFVISNNSLSNMHTLVY